MLHVYLTLLVAARHPIGCHHDPGSAEGPVSMVPQHRYLPSKPSGDCEGQVRRLVRLIGRLAGGGNQATLLVTGSLSGCSAIGPCRRLHSRQSKVFWTS